jgi:hypothetical protein
MRGSSCSRRRPLCGDYVVTLNVAVMRILSVGQQAAPQ